MKGARTNQNDEHVAVLLTDPARLAERVAEILDRQIELFERLEALSADQRRLIDSRDTEALLALLSRRSNLVQRLDSVGKEFAPFRARWSEVLRTLAEAQRQSIENRLSQLEAVAERVAKRDEEDRLALAGERDDAARELASIKQGSAAVAAYGPGQARSEPRFHDREG